MPCRERAGSQHGDGMDAAVRLSVLLSPLYGATVSALGLSEGLPATK